jgi:hypothetical protein
MKKPKSPFKALLDKFLKEAAVQKPRTKKRAVNKTRKPKEQK